MPPTDPEQQELLAELLDVLDLPRSGVHSWLDHMERFYNRHGGRRRYDDCLSLLTELRQALGNRGD